MSSVVVVAIQVEDGTLRNGLLPGHSHSLHVFSLIRAKTTPRVRSEGVCYRTRRTTEPHHELRNSLITPIGSGGSTSRYPRHGLVATSSAITSAARSRSSVDEARVVQGDTDRRRRRAGC
jgi:hypothetical protein